MRILHIEDDADLKKWVKQGLLRDGFTVDGAGDAKEGLQLAKENTYDIILLDIGMPEVSGLEILKKIREAGITAPIFMISGQGGEAEKLQAFAGGADDYLVKPIFITELTARIHTWFKRREQMSNDSSPTELTTGTIRLNLLQRRVTVKGKTVSLTPKEFMVLEYLLRHRGRVVTQTAITQAVWEFDFETRTNVVEVHINRLRDKIDEDGKPSLIQTVRESGYMIEADPS